MHQTKTIVHVNVNTIRSNGKQGTTFPPITAKKGKSNRYAHEVVIKDSRGRPVARVLYRPDKPLSCGAKVWIEADYEVETKLSPSLDQEIPCCS